ncbi:hypothetical protein Z517_12276 [Fonsecaea pedrosoi CBS 271.37]|uniref:Uncharacterized protein n=1 Tax=Fonsecaea pedrosoi CBS 271.37 TaxID=1442368 RepID=A0A0D2D9Q8_9EURO|nr:uncharacterized protein Z517_12276 [Fonsecaea pedrosoi CBS 271.37]KIW74336.1 hypothetical protein Z517_12276 [Fonsecaea pedrosoi CBS 271.37]
MSFGFSLGDLVTVPQFAWNVYHTCKKSPSEARVIASELFTLCGILQTLGDGRAHYMRTLAENERVRLLSAYNVCRDVLEEVSATLRRHSELSKDNPHLFARLKWGAEDVPALRLRIISSTSLLTAIQSSRQSLSESRVEDKVDQILSRLDSSPYEWFRSPSSPNRSLEIGHIPQRLLPENENDNRLMLPLEQLNRSSLLQLPASIRETQTPIDSESRKGLLKPSRRLLGSFTRPFSHSKPSTSTKSDDLPRAAAASNIPKIQHLLMSGYPVDHVDSSHGYTALHNAGMSGCVTTLALLLSHSASVSIADVNGATALHHAAQNGHVDASLLLIQKGADIDAADSAGHAPLFYALQNGHLSVANALLGLGAKMALLADGGQTYDYWASRLAPCAEEIRRGETQDDS